MLLREGREEQEHRSSALQRCQSAVGVHPYVAFKGANLQRTSLSVERALASSGHYVVTAPGTTCCRNASNPRAHGAAGRIVRFFLGLLTSQAAPIKRQCRLWPFAGV